MQLTNALTLQVLTAVAALVSAGLSFFAAYFGAYAKKKGESLATREEFQNALTQLHASTTTVEGIKSSVAKHALLSQELRGAGQKLTVASSSLIHSMCWLTWDTKTRGRLNPDLVRRYDEEVHRIAPEISGQLALIATYDLGLHTALAPLITRLFDMDARIGAAVVAYEEAAPKKKPRALEQIKSLHAETLAFEQSHRTQIADSLNQHFVASVPVLADDRSRQATARPKRAPP